MTSTGAMEEASEKDTRGKHDEEPPTPRKQVRSNLLTLSHTVLFQATSDSKKALHSQLRVNASGNREVHFGAARRNDSAGVEDVAAPAVLASTVYRVLTVFAQTARPKRGHGDCSGPTD